MMSQSSLGASSSEDRAAAADAVEPVVSSPCAFTPGPWQYLPCDRHGERVADRIMAGDSIIVVVDVHLEADARLIATAPELYEIGAELLAIFQHPTRSVTIIEQERLERALAKARGQ